MVVLEIGVVLWRTSVSTLFAALLSNHKNCIYTIVPLACGFICKTAVIKYHQLLLKIIAFKNYIHYEEIAFWLVSNSFHLYPTEIWCELSTLDDRNETWGLYSHLSNLIECQKITNLTHAFLSCSFCTCNSISSWQYIFQ